MSVPTASDIGSPGDEQLGEDDIFDILQELKSVAARWRDIGLALGLRDSALEVIKSEGQGDVYELLRTMIVKWLKMSYNVSKFGKPTWRRIVEAVRAGGRNPALADDLARRKYMVIQDTQPVAVPTQPSSIEISPPEVHTRVCCCCPVKGGTQESAHNKKGSRHSLKSDQHPLLPEAHGIYLPHSSKPHQTGVVFIKHPHRVCRSYSQSLPNSPSLEYELEEPNIFESDLEESKDTISAHPTWKIKDISQQKSYWGAMTGAQAEERLKIYSGNCYLIRYSERKQHHILSVQTRNQQLNPVAYHFTLNITKENNHTVYEIDGTEQNFTDISSLLEFYRHNPLTPSDSVMYIGKACIRPPV